MNAKSEARLASMMVDARKAVRKGAHWYTASELIRWPADLNFSP